MAYAIKTTDGTALTTIADGTVNIDSSSLTLIGKNYAGYGVFFNENFVKLLENFSNTTAPNSAITGQLWYDSNSQVLKVYNSEFGGTWKPISSTATGASAPLRPVTGDLWWDTVNAQLKVNNSGTWVTVGPVYSNTAGTSGAIVESILDNFGNNHVVVKFYIANDVVSILSKDPTFVPQTPIAGFTTVRPGMNLASESAIAGAQYTGTVANSLALGGLLANQFLRNDQNTATPWQLTATGGVVAGTLQINTSNIGTVNLTNPTLDSDIEVWVNKASVTTKALAIDGATGQVIIVNALVPDSTGNIDIGSASLKFGNIHATNFIGNALSTITRTVGDSSTNVASTAFVATAIVNATGTLGTMSQQNANAVNITGGTITNATVNSFIVGANSVGARTVSTAVPTGGVDGDIWYRY